MIITCEACGTRYKIKAGLIGQNGSTVKCCRCQHIFVAYPSPAETEEPAEYSRQSPPGPAREEPETGTRTFLDDTVETEKQLDELFPDDLKTTVYEETEEPWNPDWQGFDDAGPELPDLEPAPEPEPGSEPERESEAAGASTEEDDLDLDLDLDEIDLHLDTAGPEEQAGAIEFLEEEPEELELDLDEADTDELDLSDVEELLTKTEEDEDFDIDLSTILYDTFDGADVEKDVSLEAVEEETQQEDVPAAEGAGRHEVAAAAGMDMGAAAVAETPPAESGQSKTAESEEGPAPARKPAKRGGRRIAVLLLALIVLGIIGGGYAYYFNEFGVRDYVNGLLGIRTASAYDPGNRQIAVSSPDYRIVANQQAGNLLVVTGSVTNQYDHARSHILVQANLFDASGNRIKKKAAYCGNVLGENQLRTLEMKNINEQLSRIQGKGGVNAGVAPGQSIPYMVVLSNLPENIASLTVEVLSSGKAQ